jgi:hypothetical protein
MPEASEADEQFIVGEVYFRVKYPGPTMDYPTMDSLVFIGKNLSDEDTEDTWYFQFADAYAKTGSVLSNSGGDRRVVCVPRNELHEMLDDHQLLEKIIAATRRRRAKSTVE